MLDIIDICIYWKDVKIYLNILKSHNNKCKKYFYHIINLVSFSQTVEKLN